MLGKTGNARDWGIRKISLELFLYLSFTLTTKFPLLLKSGNLRCVPHHTTNSGGGIPFKYLICNVLTQLKLLAALGTERALYSPASVPLSQPFGHDWILARMQQL